MDYLYSLPQASVRKWEGIILMDTVYTDGYKALLTQE